MMKYLFLNGFMKVFEGGLFLKLMNDEEKDEWEKWWEFVVGVRDVCDVLYWYFVSRDSKVCYNCFILFYIFKENCFWIVGEDV